MVIVGPHRKCTLSVISLPSVSPLLGEGNGNPLQYSCLENPVDRGAWWAAVHEVAQSQTQVKRLSLHACIGEGNGNRSSNLAWRIPETEKPGGLLSVGLHRVGHDWSNLAAAAAAPFCLPFLLLQLGFHGPLLALLCLHLHSSSSGVLAWQSLNHRSTQLFTYYICIVILCS